MQYLRAYTSFFDSPKWGLNLLWGVAGQLVPILGWMSWTGWLEERLRAAPDSEPDFDPQQIGRYFSLGIWPFLMQLVIGLGVLALLLPLFLPLLAAALTCTGLLGGGGWLLGGLSLLASLLFLPAGVVVMEFVTLPVNLLASFEQDFVRALDWQVFQVFTGKVRRELWLSSTFLTTSSWASPWRVCACVAWAPCR